MDKRIGRPPKSGDEPFTDRMEIRLLAGEKDAYQRAADAAGMDRSDWIRETLNAGAKRALSRPTRRK